MGQLWLGARVVRRLQFAAQAPVFRLVEGDVGVIECGLLRHGEPLCDKIGEVWQAELLVQCDEMS